MRPQSFPRRSVNQAGKFLGGPRNGGLPGGAFALMSVAMFCVSGTEAAAIRAAYEREGELSAAIEVRRLFPGITDNTHARTCARMIAGWTPLPATPGTVTRLDRTRVPKRP